MLEVVFLPLSKMKKLADCRKEISFEHLYETMFDHSIETVSFVKPESVFLSSQKNAVNFGIVNSKSGSCDEPCSKNRDWRLN